MFEAFYEKYAPEEQEVVALIRNCIGGGYNNKGDFWEMTAISLGMVFCATGENNIREGRLEWPVTEEDRNSEEGWGRFGKEQICRIRVRKLLDEYVPNHTPPPRRNSTAGLSPGCWNRRYPARNWKRYWKNITSLWSLRTK